MSSAKKSSTEQRVPADLGNNLHVPRIVTSSSLQDFQVKVKYQEYKI